MIKLSRVRLKFGGPETLKLTLEGEPSEADPEDLSLQTFYCSDFRFRNKGV